MKRITLKVGSSVLAENNEIAKQRMLNLVSLIVKLKQRYEVILVTSGAVAAGATALKLDRKINISKKVLASVGQPILMSSYKAMFDIYDTDTSQILLTEEDFDSVTHINIVKQIIDALIENNILPVVNENDITTISEQVFGDNDQLAAHVAHHTNSDLLVILSDIDGYYDKNPSVHNDAKIISYITEIPQEALDKGHTPTNTFATGGIVTKLKAANFLMKKNRKMFLCNGYDLTAAEDFLLNSVQSSGTLFQPEDYDGK
ncbi:glutamate 5-kinase [Marinicellulosiphila megalodicopiae]|uniref:glutamate 5-kinase n=1 Tax=Marinicellulosiphila megalodicopiae TaxID=2724896 RepID=UPI003BAFD8E8